MGRRIVIIGAVALGPKVACRARRLDPDADILLVDRDDLISYGGCGIPYYVSDDVSDLVQLRKTTYDAVRDEAFFRDYKRVRVKVRTEATAIDRRARTVTLRNLDSGAEELAPYDALVLGTGSIPFVPPVQGASLKGVFSVANLHDARAVKALLLSGKIGSAVVVGAGPIGLEMAEGMADLWGVATTVVEMAPQILPQSLGPDMARLAQNELERREVRVLTGDRLLGVLDGGSGQVTGVSMEKAGEIPCQLVIFATGVRPNATLARDAGLALGPAGGVLVDDRMRTSDPNVYAGGDCVELRNLVSGESVHVPLGSLANRQGRVIGTNVTGGHARFTGTVGTFCIKLFGIGVARAGLTEAQARAAGFDPVCGLMGMSDRAHFYPTEKMMFLKLIADRRTRKILGIEALGENGDAVKARVDAVAALLPHGPTTEDVSNLEVGYSPPYASAMDILNACANTLENILDGRNTPMSAGQFLEQFKKGELTVVDIRAPETARPGQAKYGARWVSIPLDTLSERWAEVPRDRDAVLLCSSGLRSYESQRILSAKGIELPHVQGGWFLLRGLDPGLLEVEDKA
jgi:NADPH-dependent 2,4-dienoyl-CoA reductase/sulfur reductase-like enzyme/rhodanese-related sulfurtransferase